MTKTTLTGPPCVYMYFINEKGLCRYEFFFQFNHVLYHAHRVISTDGHVDVLFNGPMEEQPDWIISLNNPNGEPVYRLSRVLAEFLSKINNKNVLKNETLFKI